MPPMSQNKGQFIVRVKKNFFKPILQFMIAFILIPILNMGWFLLVALQNNALGSTLLGEQMTFELLLLSGLIDALRRGRYPSRLEILSLPFPEQIAGIIAVWFIAALILLGCWLALSAVLRKIVPRRRRL